MKIVVSRPLELNEEQLDRLKHLGELVAYDTAEHDPKAWLKRVESFDVIITGKAGFKGAWRDLKNTFVVYFVIFQDTLTRASCQNPHLMNRPGV